MGVDYEPEYGIGYKLFLESVDSYYELKESLPDNFFCFRVGESSYCGGDDDYFICSSEPFENGLDLTSKKEELDKFISENEIEKIGEYGLVGDLYVS